MHVAELHFISEPWRVFAWVFLLFVLAWIVSRASKRLAEWAVARYERRHTDVSKANTGAIIGLRRRETIISLVQTSVRYAAYGIATVVAVVQLAGLGSRGALAGASLVVVLVGFAAQRFLIDILTGFFMQFEGWFSIGDTITIEPWGLEGIVEEISLRYTRLRALNGELLFVHNSQVNALRRLPRGLR
jgi:small conductance mechanosensitive channel